MRKFEVYVSCLEGCSCRVKATLLIETVEKPLEAIKISQMYANEAHRTDIRTVRA